MKVLAVLALFVFFVLPGGLRAAAAKDGGCRLIIDAATGQTLVREGPCDLQRTPCSTFKVPLAVMGFDAGILKNEHDPVWDYRPEFESFRKDDRIPIDPTSWEAISVVWYSQELTRKLGMNSFQKYVDQFNYGNRDLSGNPGKKDGLTQSWLMSSLKISADEQVAFLQKLLQRQLKVSDHAYAMTEAILPEFKAEDGWTLKGKTGSGFQRKPDGTLDRKMHQGWFVGWATKGQRRVIFAEVLVDEKPNDNYAGPRSREALIKALPGIMQGK